MVRVKVSTKALVVAQPQRCAVSVTVLPAVSSSMAWKTRVVVRHWGYVVPNSPRKSRAR